MDEQLQADICARIKQARVEAGFTLQEAADTLGVTLRAWQNYEAIRVPFRQLNRIAEMFGVSQGWLLRGEAEAKDADRLDEIARRLESLEAQVAESVAVTKEALRLLRAARRQAGEAPRAPRQANG